MADAALLRAAEVGDANAVRAALQSGAGPSSADEHGLTALCRAAQRGHARVLQLLLERGGNLHAADRVSRTSGCKSPAVRVPRVSFMFSLMCCAAAFRCAERAHATALRRASSGSCVCAFIGRRRSRLLCTNQGACSKS